MNELKDHVSILELVLMRGTMNDLRQFALQLLEIEKRFLIEDKEEYRAAVAVVVTPGGRYSEEAEFENEEQKIDTYTAIVDRAKQRHASAIITINTSFVQSDVPTDYRWGDLEHAGAPRVITLTISGPLLEPVSLSLPFSVEAGSVNIGQMSDFEHAVIGLLPGWP